MTRKSQRLSSGSKAATPTPKRVASNIATPSTVAKRSKTQKATPTKSPHFLASTQDVESTQDEEDEVDVSSPDDGEASEFGDDVEESPLSESDKDEDSDSDDVPKSRKKTTPKRGETLPTTIRTKSNDLWRPGVSAGLGPGKQVVIKKPKARATGKTPYQDETIHPNTLLFLKDLKANNDRQWLKNFRQSERDWYSYVEKLTEKLIEIDPTIPELPVKDVIFRIYRDVRFTSDPTPYKPHFSGAWSRTGRKGPYAAYYVQIGPNESFVARII